MNRTPDKERRLVLLARLRRAQKARLDAEIGLLTRQSRDAANGMAAAGPFLDGALDCAGGVAAQALTSMARNQALMRESHEAVDRLGTRAAAMQEAQARLEARLHGHAAENERKSEEAVLMENLLTATAIRRRP